ncbi:hypothetical protein [Bacillus sp. ISL-57]|uniref:hypothetical protein n=1 Tax=Bacillus sp. ISL-57 TaxID=2819135 RepID=UPI001BEBF495|nr:hypothetical protein [Bacillus sp. ISL-57]MBT2718065.1 hypothetical protein [Bacillus sp. ISL-57]
MVKINSLFNKYGQMKSYTIENNKLVELDKYKLDLSSLYPTIMKKEELNKW